MVRKYDPNQRQSEHGSRLYQLWRKIKKLPHDEVWVDYRTFYNWAMESGYELDMFLRLIDDNEPWGPNNCVWIVHGSKKNYIPSEWADGWNKTVNRIRKHYGMPPLEGTSYGDV